MLFGDDGMDERRGSSNDFIKVDNSASRYALNYGHINARSIPCHVDEITFALSLYDIQVLGVSETFLKRGALKALYNIDGYNVIRHDRLRSACGGVALYIQNGLRTKIVQRSESDAKIEYLLIEINLCGARILCGVFYIPPPTSNSDANNFFNILTEHCLSYSHSIIMGDFNFNLMASSSNTFQTLVSSLSMNFVPFRPTRENSLLDLFIIPEVNCNRILKFAQWDVPGIADHDFIAIKYNHRCRKPPINFIMRKDISRINMDALLTNLHDSNLEIIYTMSDCNSQLEYLNRILKSLYDIHVPSRRKYQRAPSVPWFNGGVLFWIKERDNAYAVWKKSRTVSNRIKFCEIRNKVKQVVRESKRKYFYKKIEKARGSDKLWNTLKQLGYINSSNASPDIDPNSFNAHFTRIPATSPVLPLPFSDQISDSGIFNFINTTESDVILSIFSIKSNAVGSDEISLSFIKLLLPFIVPYITHIFNFCITSCQFPESWKKALVVPVPKTQSASATGDFRPISILPVLSKAFEIIMKTQIEDFLNQNNFLAGLQSGFRKRHSTATALAKVTYDIMKSLNSQFLTILLLLDFSKAFDSLNHELLCQKLFLFYNFSALSVKLIYSYLSGRSQQVKVGSNISTLLPIQSGVPQGSVLGSLFFSLYINDLPGHILYSLYHLYADDCQIYISDAPENASHLVRKLNEDLSRISAWSLKNGLILNPKKTQAILISKQKKSYIPALPPITLNGVMIEFSDTVKNLGVIFNRTLTWSDHITLVSKKAHFGLHSLRQLSFLTPETTRMMLARSLIVPFFTYCDHLFYNADAESLRRLTVAFNSCVRYVYNLKKYDHVSHFSCTILDCSFSNYLKYRVCCFIFKLVFLKHPSYLFSLISFGSSPRTFNIQSISDRFSSKQFSTSMFVHGFHLWNSLPNNIKQSKSLSEFMRLSFQYFKLNV